MFEAHADGREPQQLRVPVLTGRSSRLIFSSDSRQLSEPQLLYHCRTLSNNPGAAFQQKFFSFFFSVKSQGTIYIFFFFYFTSLQHLSDGSRYYPRWQKNVYITAPCQIKKSHPKLIKSNYSKMYKVHHQAAVDLSMHQYENSIT